MWGVVCSHASYPVNRLTLIWIWTYCTISEVDYVAALASLPADLLVDWYGQYTVRANALCSRKALFPAQFWWRTRKGVEYWGASVRFERRGWYA